MTIPLLNLLAVLLALGLLVATVRLAGRRPAGHRVRAHDWPRQQTAPDPEPAERW
jgi:hypothetical protein